MADHRSLTESVLQRGAALLECMASNSPGEQDLLGGDGGDGHFCVAACGYSRPPRSLAVGGQFVVAVKTEADVRKGLMQRCICGWRCCGCPVPQPCSMPCHPSQCLLPVWLMDTCTSCGQKVFVCSHQSCLNGLLLHSA